MKIAYIFSWDLTKNDGVSKKILQQIASWEKMGCTVAALCISPKKNDILKYISFYNFGLFRTSPGPEELKKDLELYKPDIVYFRYEIWKPWFSYVFKRFSTIVEVNSDDVDELRLKREKGFRGFKHYYWNILTRSFIFQKSAGVIFVTNELSESRHFRFQKPKIVIPNSIIPESIPILKSPVEADVIKLVFIVSSDDSWHGIDKAKVLIKELGLNYKLRIIGTNQTNNAVSNIENMGFLSGKDLYEAIAECQVALGTLALHRKKLSEACPLKIRECCTMGFPAIIAYKDTAFIDEAPEWILEIPNTEDVLNDKNEIERIKKFIDKMKNRIVDKKESAKYFDANTIEEKRIKFMDEVIVACTKSSK